MNETLDHLILMLLASYILLIDSTPVAYLVGLLALRSAYIIIKKRR